MAIEDQYYIDRNVIDRGVSDVGVFKEFFSGAALSSPLETIGSGERNITPVVHAPFSQVHMERVKRDLKGEYVKDEEGNICLHPETGQRLQIPYSEEVSREALMQAFLRESSLLAPSAREVVWREAHLLSKRPFTGDYHPEQLGPLPEGQTVDPAIFILTTVMELSRQKGLSGNQADMVFVMHPDILYFLSKGDASRVKETASHLEHAFSVLGVKSAYENVCFSNLAFDSALGWMSDPMELRRLLPEDSGICLDVTHLERSGWSAGKIVEAIHTLSLDSSSAFVVHVDSSYSSTGKGRAYILEAYKRGIAVVYETRAHN